MGLSASQARMLQLTARKSDLEYQMQQIASARLDLTNQMTAISKNYNDALNDRILYYQASGTDGSTTKTQLTHMHLIQKGYQVYDTTSGETIQPLFSINLNDMDLSNTTLQSILGETATSSNIYLTGSDGSKTGITQENLLAAGYGVKITEAGTAAGTTEIKDEDLVKGLQEGRYTLTNNETGEDVNYKSVPALTEESNTIANITSYSGGKFYIENGDKKLQIIFGATDENGKSKEEGYDENENVLYLNWDRLQKTNIIDADNLEEGLREGRYQIVIPNGEGEDPTVYDWRSSSFILDELDTSNDSAAVATYDVESAEAQSKDKTLELKLKNLENEHKAVETEIESVQKVITKNIEGSFKTFV